MVFKEKATHGFCRKYVTVVVVVGMIVLIVAGMGYSVSQHKYPNSQKSNQRFETLMLRIIIWYIIGFIIIILYMAFTGENIIILSSIKSLPGGEGWAKETEPAGSKKRNNS